MMESRISRALMLLGATIGVLSVAVSAADVAVNIPDWMVRVAMFKLAFVASAGLLAAGALLGRHARKRVPPDESPELLPRQPAQPLDQSRASPTPQEIERERGHPR